MRYITLLWNPPNDPWRLWEVIEELQELGGLYRELGHRRMAELVLLEAEEEDRL